MKTNIKEPSSARVYPIPEEHLNGNAIAVRNGPRSQKLISGIRKEWIELIIRINIAIIAIRNYSNPVQWIKILGNLDKLRRNILGERRIRKVVQIDKRYYWDLYVPGSHSRAFTKFIEGEMNRIYFLKKRSNQFTNIFIAITKKCPLRCEHCFEWDALNGKERLSLDDLKSIVLKFQEN